MSSETIAYKSTYSGKEPPTILTHETEQPLLRARIAIDFISRWGMVAGMEDGEDSSGRSKLRLATPEEVVNRAVEITKLMFDAFDDMEWMHYLPTIEEAEELIKLQEVEDDRISKSLKAARDAIAEATEE